MSAENINSTINSDQVRPQVVYDEYLAQIREEKGMSDIYKRQRSLFIPHTDPTPRANRKEMTNPKLEEVLGMITYPTPSLEDKRDYDESQIYQLLGDITLPRSFLPAINVISQQRLEVERKAAELYFKDKPYRIEEFEEANVDWIGKSKEVDEKFLEDQDRKLLNLLTGTREITRLRADAWKLYRDYTNSNISRSGLCESYYIRKSIELWEIMSNEAKNFLRYGVDRNLRLELDEVPENKAQEKVKEIVKSMSDTGPTGTLYIDDGSPDEFYNWNSIDFQFDGDQIVGLRLDEATRNMQHSPLLSLIESSLNLTDVHNKISDREQVGPFNVDVIYHAFAYREHQVIIDLNTSDWDEDKKYQFIANYIEKIRNEPKTKGKSALHQLKDLGIKDAI